VKLWTSGEPTLPLAEPDVAALDTWWREHRGEYAADVRWLTRAIADDLGAAVAKEIAGGEEVSADSPVTRIVGKPPELLGPANQARSVELLKLLTGRELEFDREAKAEKRLEQARRIAETLDALQWK
jgi:hypothetical protein